MPIKMRFLETLENPIFYSQLNMKSLTPISPEKKKKEKELSSMLESMENKHGKLIDISQRHI